MMIQIHRATIDPARPARGSTRNVVRRRYCVSSSSTFSRAVRAMTEEEEEKTEGRGRGGESQEWRSLGKAFLNNSHSEQFRTNKRRLDVTREIKLGRRLAGRQVGSVGQEWRLVAPHCALGSNG